jgi:hypothetical protein
VRARAVIARDLRELRAEEEKLQNPVPQPSENVAIATTQEKIDSTPAERSTRDEGLVGQPTDIIKTEDAHDTVVRANDHQMKHESLDTAVQAKDHQMKHEPSDTVDLVQEQPNAEALQNSQKLQDEIKQNIADTSTLPAEIVAADGQETDKSQEAPNGDLEAPDALETNDDMTYESLFGPESAHDDHPDLNFDDFDFGAGNTAADHNQDQGQDYTQNDGQIDLSTFGEHSDQQYGNDDESSMLQGLESYANQVPEDSGDIIMLDAASSAGNGDSEGEAIHVDGGENDNVGMSGADLDLAMGLGGNETNFDDLLDGLDFEGGGDDQTGLENQEFDDAYFGIGDS